MTHTLIKRGQARGQGGFAIGLILLVVLLIAIIIAAIALATRNSSNKGNEKDRVAASNLIQQAVTLDQGVQRITAANGAPPWSVFTARDSASLNSVYNLGNNLFGANGAYGQHPDVDLQVFDGKCANASSYVNLSTATALAAADNSFAGCQWHITTVWGASAAAVDAFDFESNSKSSVGVLYTFPIKGSIGSQLNNVLWGVPVGESLYTVGASASGDLGKNLIVTDDPGAGGTPVQPGGALNTKQGTALTWSSITLFNKAFGNAASVTTSPKQIGLHTVATSSTISRFPVILNSERSEGVVAVGVTPTDDSVAYVPTTGAAKPGARVYYRALNAPVAD